MTDHAPLKRKSKPRPPRAQQRQQAAEPRIFKVRCDLCGLERCDAPVATRWVRGFAFTLCFECWTAPTDAHRAALETRIAAAEEAASPESKRDRDERVETLMLEVWRLCSASMSEGEESLLHLAREEWVRLDRLAKRDLPYRRTLRAARAAKLRGLARTVREDAPEAAPFIDLEREAYARELFTGFCRAWEVPVELEEWVFRSAAAGKWLPISPDGTSGLRLEPQVGPYFDHHRADSPPCITWGRNTGRKERGTGSWVTALNKERSWSQAKKAPLLLQHASAEERKFHAELRAEFEAHGAPSKSGPPSQFGIDREDLKYRMHRRMCPKCQTGRSGSNTRLLGRKTHLFVCAKPEGMEGPPRLSWIDDQLDRSWNRQLCFTYGLARLSGCSPT